MNKTDLLKGYRELEEGEIILEGDCFLRYGNTELTVLTKPMATIGDKYCKEVHTAKRYRKIKNMENNTIKFYVDTKGNKKIAEALADAAKNAGYTVCETGGVDFGFYYNFYYRLSTYPNEKTEFGFTSNVKDRNLNPLSIEQALDWFENNPKKKSIDYQLACGDTIQINPDSSITYKHLNVNSADVKEIIRIIQSDLCNKLTE